MHLDAEIAKSVGLPGIIIHGLCTMAFTSVAAVQSCAAATPRRLRGWSSLLAAGAARPGDHHHVLGRR